MPADRAANDRPPASTPLGLWLAGGVQLALYAGILSLSERFSFGATDRPILEIVGLFLAATLCWGAALFMVLRWRSDPAGAVRVILLFAVLDRALLLPSRPILEVDFYRYLWDGRVTSHGFNPYHYSPWQVRDHDFADRPAPELTALAALAGESDALQTILQRVHYPEVPTVYPPAAQAVFAAAAGLTPIAAPVDVQIKTLKALLLTFDLGTVAVLIALLRRLQLPASWCLAYAWCPLVVKEVANSGHLDSIAVFFTTLALYVLVRSSTLAAACAAAACLGLGVLAKSYPVVLLPAVAAWLLARLRGRALVPLMLVPAVVVAGYLPFLGRPVADSASPATGLGAFLTQWETNDFLFMLVYDNLKPPGETAGPHVIVPEAWRSALHLDRWHDVIGLPLKAQTAFVLTQALMGGVLLVLAARWAWQVYRRPEPPVLLRSAFLTLSGAWLLGSAANPWYLLWGLPLAVFAGRGSWFLLPGLVWLYYVRFWVDALPWAGRSVNPDDLVWIEYVPFFVALAVESWWCERRSV